MDMQKAQDFYNHYSLRNSLDHEQLIKPGSNLLIIILESFSNKIISGLGGENDITPCLNDLCEQSIVFTNFYASGDRSDKGLVSIFSGYPSQPTTSIIDYPSKSQKLPFIYDNFSGNGYATAFYYGGDLNFANFKSYFTHPSMDLLVSVEDFDRKYFTQKWGVPDEYLFEKLLTDLDTMTKPFFYSCFTLSSHEPFDVPMDPRFGTKSRDQLSKNGFFYTDSVLNNFLNKARKSDWWENTLIVITADHGSRSPGNTPNHTKEKFQIPMIWTGGAILKSDTTISTIGSQTDIPATLLAQFSQDYSEFSYSFDILNTENEGQAFYAFNNGFGFAYHDNFVIFDNDFRKCISSSGSDMNHSLEIGKAILQVFSADFISR
jgi:phosphoglycerol transferase MdoB-like AlkP superfamily enzyme